jgi:hypothetical protein
VGYADRPRLHDALGLDAQSRGIRFSFATGESNSNSNGFAKPDSYLYAYAYSDGYAKPDAYGHVRGGLHDDDWLWGGNPRRY